jgi:S1-C subfamily serine protease
MWSRVRRARLTFAEGDIAEAIVLSDDPDTDLALLSAAPPPGTSAARLGDAKVLRRGHLVVARDELAGGSTCRRTAADVIILIGGAVLTPSIARPVVSAQKGGAGK